jgi:hypothetical protein
LIKIQKDRENVRIATNDKTRKKLAMAKTKKVVEEKEENLKRQHIEVKTSKENRMTKLLLLENVDAKMRKEQSGNEILKAQLRELQIKVDGHSDIDLMQT